MEELTRAKKRALYILADCDKTEKQLYDKLKKTGYSDEAIMGAMDYVRGFGYLDDGKYAVRYILYYREKKSRARLKYDLAKKGLSQALIAEAFEEAGEWDERPAIRVLAEKKLSKMDRTDPKAYRKLAAFLSGRGYRTDDVMAVLGQLAEGLPKSSGA
ncbi:MAG: regulatory protein RecX [Lachnospiraceae bacterium]|nr:regulatory protein RecX [Lachnospiraceae bacterium]